MCRAQNQVLRNYSINWIFLRTPTTQNHSKPSITEKRRNKQISDLKFHRLKLVKQSSMPNPVKSLGYIKCYSSSRPTTVKSPSNSIRYNRKKICSLSGGPKTILGIRKKPKFLQVINNSIIYKFFKYFTNHRKKTNRAVFSCEPFPSIFKYWGHC